MTITTLIEYRCSLIDRLFQNHCALVLTCFSLNLKINMDKISEKVIKDPKRVEASRKGREKHMNKLKRKKKER